MTSASQYLKKERGPSSCKKEDRREQIGKSPLKKNQKARKRGSSKKDKKKYLKIARRRKY